MPTVSQHYGHHAVPGAVDEIRTRQQAAPVVLMVSGGADWGRILGHIRLGARRDQSPADF